MFLHTNLSPKWNLRIPAALLDLRRRWEVLQPGGRPFREALLDFDDSSTLTSSPPSASVDLEGEVHDFLAALSCDGRLQRYAEEMAARANALREREERQERREDEELERLEREEEEEKLKGKGKAKQQQQQQQRRRQKGGEEEDDDEKPPWRIRAEKRRAERLEEERRRDRELRRRRKEAAALAAARAKSRRHRSRRGGGDEGDEESDEDGDDDLSSLFLVPGADEKELLSNRPPRVSAADLLPRGLPPGSFHPLNPGVDFAAAFRWGLRGTFEEFTPLGPLDWLLHLVNGGVRPAGRRVRRGLAFLARGGRGYFRPF